MHKRAGSGSLQKSFLRQIIFSNGALILYQGVILFTASMKKLLLFLFLLCGCQSITVPPEYVYKEIQTENFRLASWQKISSSSGIYKFYIEGDGTAFDAYGRPTSDPTPRGTLVRELAFGDTHGNVIYLARPCQYLMRGICTQRHWTTARFAPEIINSEYEAVKKIAGNNPVVLVGFSGGAQVAGLLAATKPDLNVRKIITVAGNLNHLTWTQHHKVPPLTESLNLENYRAEFLKIPQIHYAGSEDDIIPPQLIKDFAGQNAQVVTVDGATHNSGWEKVFNEIQKAD